MAKGIVPPLERGRSSGVEHNLAKVRAEGSNPFARSNEIQIYRHFMIATLYDPTSLPDGKAGRGGVTPDTASDCYFPEINARPKAGQS